MFIQNCAKHKGLSGVKITCKNMQKELLFKQKKRKYTKRATVQAEEEEIYKKSYCSSRRRGIILLLFCFTEILRSFGEID